uniref:Uncharacterized protein n=1 Tax=Panagrolaimus davidi TaxID=227884 RepID=A0A914P2W0_9BILA
MVLCTISGAFFICFHFADFFHQLTEIVFVVHFILFEAAAKNKMDLFTILWFGASAFLIFFISPLIGCGGKKPAAAAGADGAVGADGKPAVPTKACNTKSGLLNDDPDLKSDLLMAKPAAAPAAAAASASGAGGGEKEPSVAAPAPA